jgi:hypothetical protein
MSSIGFTERRVFKSVMASDMAGLYGEDRA